MNFNNHEINISKEINKSHEKYEICIKYYNYIFTNIF